MIITVSQAATIKVTLDVGVFIQDSDGVPAIVYGVNGITNAPIVMSMGDVLEATVKVSEKEITIQKRSGTVVKQASNPPTVLQNNLNESTSIHWHGIFQRFTNDQDGADMATQCGIPPGQSLVYSFPIPDQAGTFWWHAHKGAQYIKGLRGPLIVLDPNDPYENAYDDEIVMTLSDWYHGDLSSIIKEYLSPGGDGSEPAPDSVVLNDLGQYNCTMEGREEGDHNQVKCKAPPVFSVVRGKSYRIRIINMAAMGSFNFSIDGHKVRFVGECEWRGGGDALNNFTILISTL